MKCIKCNAELNDDAAFCSSCGEKQEQITEVVENAVENADVSAEAEICEDSTATESENTAPEGETAPAKRKKKKIKIAPLIISAVLVVILAVGAVIGIPILRDYMLTKELDPVLANKAFQYSDVTANKVIIERYTFFPDNKVTIERYDSESDSTEQYTEYYTAKKDKYHNAELSTNKDGEIGDVHLSYRNSGKVSNVSTNHGTFSRLDEETKLPFDEEIKKQTRESESLKTAEENAERAVLTNKLTFNQIRTAMEAKISEFGVNDLEYETSVNEYKKTVYQGACMGGFWIFAMGEENGIITSITTTTTLYNTNIGPLYTTEDELQNAMFNFISFSLSGFTDNQKKDVINNLLNNFTVDGDTAAATYKSGNWTITFEMSSMLMLINATYSG